MMKRKFFTFVQRDETADFYFESRIGVYFVGSRGRYLVGTIKKIRFSSRDHLQNISYNTSREVTGDDDVRFTS